MRIKRKLNHVNADLIDVDDFRLFILPSVMSFIRRANYIKVFN